MLSREPILKTKRLNHDSGPFTSRFTSRSICPLLEAERLCLVSPRGEGRRGGKKEDIDGEKESHGVFIDRETQR